MTPQTHHTNFCVILDLVPLKGSIKVHQRIKQFRNTLENIFPERVLFLAISTILPGGITTTTFCSILSTFKNNFPEMCSIGFHTQMELNFWTTLEFVNASKSPTKFSPFSLLYHRYTRDWREIGQLVIWNLCESKVNCLFL